MSGEAKEEDSSVPSGPTYHAGEPSTSSLCYAPADWYSADWQNAGPKTGWYFFYGVLTNENKLATILGDEESLVLRPAKVLGYKLMLWGVHLVLTDGSSAAEVPGMAFRVESPLHARKLRGYMADVLKVESCRIHFDDENEDAKVIDGFAFIWDGTMSELRNIPANDGEPSLDRVSTSSSWDRLPVEIQISIFGRCRLQDVVNLRLASRAFSALIDTHEQAISREYLRIRRHGSLPSPIDESRTYTREPEDDVILLSDLFPPPTVEHSGKDTYSFRYLWSLRRRQEVCSKLANYLADSILERYLRSDRAHRAPFISKNHSQAFHEGGRAQLQFKLTPLMFYTLFFLETYARARSELQSDLYATYKAGRLPVAIQPIDRALMFHNLQAKIVHSPPFTNTATLVSTHHCIYLLVSYLRFKLSPEPPFYMPCDPWISMLLTSSGLGRIAEFFAAEKGGAITNVACGRSSCAICRQIGMRVGTMSGLLRYMEVEKKVCNHPGFRRFGLRRPRMK
ncbi:hypothetical protein ACJ72_02102 [Emergomyces africanus]|uniref:F-box domain-containing protein n=1 Tax=Emergomyces africanus TaxID=1955775 RepID=A0A1B7P3T3_9EURO|nr:hypothetical protein ACJ72_02102 [Emergomyces africanus]